METDLQILTKLDNFIINSRFIRSEIKETWTILEIIFRNMLYYESVE